MNKKNGQISKGHFRFSQSHVIFPTSHRSFFFYIQFSLKGHDILKRIKYQIQSHVIFFIPTKPGFSKQSAQCPCWIHGQIQHAPGLMAKVPRHFDRLFEGADGVAEGVCPGRRTAASETTGGKHLEQRGA